MLSGYTRGTTIKISIDIREPDREGKNAIRLVYYQGSYADPQTDKRRHKRSREPLNLFLYDKPKTPAQRLHNRENLRAVEAIRAKRLFEHETGKHRLDNNHALTSSFFDYFQQLTDQKTAGSKSNHSIWVSAFKHLKLYHRLPDITFEEVNQAFMEGFREYLIHGARTKSGTPLSRNTQYSYFNKLRSALNQAEREGLIRENPNRTVKTIRTENIQRSYLTEDELRAMAEAECCYDVLKKAFLFSCCTGLRWSDINKLIWAEVEPFYDSYRIIFHQKKTNDLQYLDLSSMAMQLMGTRQKSSARVFRRLKYSSWHNVELLRWAMKVGITKQVTFHTARHTFAVIQLTKPLNAENCFLAITLP